MTDPVAGWDDEADVVVVGMGAAGTCAAIEAAAHGARVLVVDRFHGGGATAASGAIIYAGGGTGCQQAAGFEDTPEDMARYLEMEVGDTVSGATLWRFCHDSPDMIRWLEAQGVPFDASFCPFKTSYPTDDYYLYYSGNEQVERYAAAARPAPRGHRVHARGMSGRVLFRALESAARRRGVSVRCQTQIMDLARDEAGRVVGVAGRGLAPGSGWAALHARLSRINLKATTYVPGLARLLTALLERIMAARARPYRARARRGVILAAGGFIFNRDMMRRLAPAYLDCLPLGTPGDDGAGIRLGEQAGGATAYMDRVSAWRFYVPPEALARGVLVNRSGERICAEDLYGSTQGACIAANGGRAYLIMDAGTYNEGRRQLKGQAAAFQMVAMLPMFVIGPKKAGTLSALAAKIGVSPEGLEATMAAYNDAARAGRPDAAGKAAARCCPQDRPPFYAVDCSFDSKNGVPVAAMTLGGLRVNEETGRVVRADGSAVDGLYAAGRNAVGLCSQSYVSGLSLADCVFSGRRAGAALSTDREEL